MTGHSSARGKRANWPIARHRLGEEPDDDLAARTPSERIAMVWALTLDAWASLGAPIPSYDRRDAPGRLIRRNG